MEWNSILWNHVFGFIREWNQIYYFLLFYININIFNLKISHCLSSLSLPPYFLLLKQPYFNRCFFFSGEVPTPSSSVAKFWRLLLLRHLLLLRWAPDTFFLLGERLVLSPTDLKISLFPLLILLGGSGRGIHRRLSIFSYQFSFHLPTPSFSSTFIHYSFSRGWSRVWG